MVIAVLRLLLAGAIVVILAAQVLYLPWLSGVMAEQLPGEAYMRWPILSLAILGLACVQVAIVCTLRLLGFVRDGRVFTPAAFRWVDGLIGSFVAGGMVCVATIVYQSQTVAGPPPWMFLLLCGVMTGAGLALLTWTMRALLVQATTLHDDMEMVI